MSFNGPLNGTDYSVCDFTKAPWVIGIAELTHEEVLFVKEQCEIIAVGHENDDFYIQSKYNESTQYEKAVNYETYSCVKSYNPEVNLLGINAAGIIQPEPVEELPEEPPVEEVPEEQPVEEPEAPVEEPVTEEEPVVE